MSRDKILEQMRTTPHNVRFAELCLICDFYFGQPRKGKGSHRVYRTPWKGDPRINIQNNKGKAKVYQVRQVISAIRRLKGENNA